MRHEQIHEAGHGEYSLDLMYFDRRHSWMTGPMKEYSVGEKVTAGVLDHTTLLCNAYAHGNATETMQRLGKQAWTETETEQGLLRLDPRARHGRHDVMGR
jgi:hypothetical protein